MLLEQTTPDSGIQHSKVYFLLRQNLLQFQAILQGGHVQCGSELSLATQHEASVFPVAGEEIMEKAALALKCFDWRVTPITLLSAYWPELVS